MFLGPDEETVDSIIAFPAWSIEVEVVAIGEVDLHFHHVVLEGVITFEILGS